MDVAIKVKGVTRRWIVNFIILFACVVMVLVVTLGIGVSDYYYNRVDDYIESVATSFDKLSAADAVTFNDQARMMAEQFPLRDNVEVQIIDSTGKIIVSTSGFDISGQKPDKDYDNALKSTSNTASAVYENDHGERVMACCYVLTDYSSNRLGAVRCLASMDGVDRQIFILICGIVLVGAAIIVLEAVSGVIFIRSILRPVGEVSTIARKIASGDLKARIDVHDGNDEMGQLCDAINYMAGELEESERLKNEFISSVSHELRTPLTAIKGWGETIKSAAPADKELLDKGVGVIISETERLSGLVEELLDFSRIQSGHMSYKVERVDIFAELSEAVYMYASQAAHSGIELKYTEPYAAPIVAGDSGRLKQVFINIIDNAVKYSEAGGTVRVLTEVTDGQATITVADNGIGIPDKDLAYVKDKFYKANQTVRGSGIGLAVVDEIVRHHKGKFDIFSTEGEGTTVVITLPTEVQAADPADIDTVEQGGVL